MLATISLTLVAFASIFALFCSSGTVGGRGSSSISALRRLSLAFFKLSESSSPALFLPPTFVLLKISQTLEVIKIQEKKKEKSPVLFMCA